MNTKHLLIIVLIYLYSMASAQKIPVDLVITHGKIYSVNINNKIFEAMAVDKGKIIELGSHKEITDKYESKILTDAQNKTVFPGFIDAHSHFYGYAQGLQQADLTGTRSFVDVLAIINKWSNSFKGIWITGRGWDHNDWDEKIFPDRKQLDQMFPDRPVVLIRIDGHVVLANGEALRRSGIENKRGFLPSEVEIKDGILSGILSENAADFMRSSIPVPAEDLMVTLLKTAEKNCFAAGLTTVNDAGTDKKTVLFLDSLQKSGKLKIRLTVMLSPTDENFNHFLKKGVYKTGKMSVSSVKLYADGSLGSRTSLLKKSYSDDPGKTGILSTSADRIREISSMALRSGYQMNIHAIGDSAVSLILHIYGGYLNGTNDLRWRIEHSQVVDPADISLFKKYSVIPSIQATHATSDMYWAGNRLGEKRIKWAYTYKDLLDQNGWLPNGTDFPIENISPLYTFYASVARKDMKGYPEEGFQKENALSREEALRSITIWAAKASFDEDSRGSLEPGKVADFIILDKDIMTISESEIFGTKVLKTFIDGVMVNPE